MNPYYRRLWESRDPVWRWVARLLAPAEWAYAAVVRTRNRAYDRGWLSSTTPPLPTLCVGNLTVGGTGKTPLAAWFAGALLERGCRPAIVMRGYGDDEPTVHRVLNPSIAVHVSPDRVRGVRAVAAAGHDVAVLDDAYQHRGIRAHENVVVVAAEDWDTHRRLLPRGPWREGLIGLQRASLAVVSRKSASAARAEEVAEKVRGAVPELPLARVHLALQRAVRFRGAEIGLGPAVPLAGFHAAVAVAGVARPDALWVQLERAGANVDERRTFPDHHRYTRDQIGALHRAAADGPILATLKDAVKLHPHLGSAVELYVPLQEAVWEADATEVERMLERITTLTVSGGAGSS